MRDQIKITKDSAKAGRFTFSVTGWPETREEAVEVWGLDRMFNHTGGSLHIALRAQAEALVMAYFKDHGKTDVVKGKVVPLPYNQQDPAVVEAAYAYAAEMMLEAEIPLGERVRVTDFERGRTVTAKLTDDEFLALAAERGLSVKASK